MRVAIARSLAAVKLLSTEPSAEGGEKGSSAAMVNGAYGPATLGSSISWVSRRPRSGAHVGREVLAGES